MKGGDKEKMNWDNEREEKRLIWYLLGLNDGEIGALSEPIVNKSGVCSWRVARGLSPNAIQGGQSVQKSGYKIKRKPKEKIAGVARTRKMSVKQQREEIARKKEEEIIESLPSKEEVYQKVRNSPAGQITTAQFIEEEYGDVGNERRDTIGKLRALVDKDRLLELDTDSKKGQIIWRA